MNSIYDPTLLSITVIPSRNGIVYTSHKDEQHIDVMTMTSKKGYDVGVYHHSYIHIRYTMCRNFMPKIINIVITHKRNCGCNIRSNFRHKIFFVVENSMPLRESKHLFEEGKWRRYLPIYCVVVVCLNRFYLSKKFSIFCIKRIRILYFRFLTCNLLVDKASK